MLSASKFRRLPTAGLLAGCVGVLLLFWPILLGESATLWGRGMDGSLIYWILEWGHHALGSARPWVEFWNANAFFPTKNSLAFSDSLLSAQLIYHPLRVVGWSPLSAIHLVLITCCLGGTIATDLALRRVGLRWLQRLAIIAIAHFGLATVAFLPDHLQLFAFQLGPACLIRVYLFWRDLQTRDGVIATGLFALATGMSTYFGPMSVAIVAPYSLWRFIRLAREQGLSQLIRRIVRVHLLLPIAAIGIVLTLCQLQPYWQHQQNRRRPGLREMETYAARPDSLFRDASASSFWYRPSLGKFGFWEYAYFPGYLLLLTLAGTLTLVALRMRVTNPSIGDAPSPRGWLAFCLYLLAWSWVLSLGPRIHIGSERWFLPYAALREWLPGFGGMRTPGRFGLFFGLPLGVCLVEFVRQIGLRRPAWANVVLPVLLLGAVIEALPRVQVQPFSIRHLETYTALAKQDAERAPLLILPLTGRDHMETINHISEQLKGSTLHWRPLVSGYGSGSTRQLDDFIHLDGQWDDIPDTLERLLEQATALGMTQVLIFPDDYPSKFRPLVSAAITASHRSWQSLPDGGRLTRLAPQP